MNKYIIEKLQQMLKFKGVCVYRKEKLESEVRKEDGMISSSRKKSLHFYCWLSVLESVN
jgi:hypothetical protein